MERMDKKKLWRLLPWLQPYKTWVLLLLLGAVAFFALAQAPPLFMKVLLDGALPTSDYGLVLLVVGGYFGVLLLRHVFSIVMDWAYVRLGSRIGLDLQTHLLGRILNADLRALRGRQAGDLIARLTDDVDAVKGFLSESVVDALSNLVTLLVALAIVAWFDWRLALAVALFLPLVTLPFGWLRPRLREVMARFRDVNGRYLGFVQEALSAVLPVQVGDATGAMRRRQEELGEGLIDAAVRARVWQMSAAYSAEVVGNVLSPLIVLGFGGWLVLRGQLSVGELVAAEMYATRLVSPVVMLSRTGAVVQGVLAALERIEAIESLPQRPRGEAAPPEGPAPLAARDVRFGYRPDEPVLRGISLDLLPGRFEALVGPSGSGKSTLAALLAGLYEPDGGQVSVGGIPVARMDRRPEVVALVPQEPFLFGGSLRENLLFGLRRTTDESELVEALELAGLGDFVAALPEGLESRVGERGVTISGGERQRLMLARALLVQPRFLLLDEVTAALDPTTEQEVLGCLRRWQGGERAVLLITHRIASALQAEYVYVLEDGRLAEEGEPGALLKRGGLLARLYADQTASSA